MVGWFIMWRFSHFILTLQLIRPDLNNKIIPLRTPNFTWSRPLTCINWTRHFRYRRQEPLSIRSKSWATLSSNGRHTPKNSHMWPSTRKKTKLLPSYATNMWSIWKHLFGWSKQYSFYEHYSKKRHSLSQLLWCLYSPMHFISNDALILFFNIILLIRKLFHSLFQWFVVALLPKHLFSFLVSHIGSCKQCLVPIMKIVFQYNTVLT